MKKYIPFLLIATCFGFTGWQSNFKEAQQQAIGSHKYLLLTFSGSDWCGPCIRMEKDLFEAKEFQAFADSNLVLVNADFPRQKKHTLSKQQQQQNEQLADRYNAQGSFPYTLLLNGKGEKVRVWDGYQNTKPTAFVQQIKEAIATVKQ